jgi:hypothetical protein
MSKEILTSCYAALFRGWQLAGPLLWTYGGDQSNRLHAIITYDCSLCQVFISCMCIYYTTEDIITYGARFVPKRLTPRSQPSTISLDYQYDQELISIHIK